MEFDIAIKCLNKLLKEKQPKEFSSSWIKINAKTLYQYIHKNIITENNDIDWDRVTSSLDRSFQRRWIEPRQKRLEPYELRSEVDAILAKYKDKLYTILAPLNEEDKIIQHSMVVSLVRIGQKGNISAQKELVKWLMYITDDWIDRYSQICRWKGYTDEVENTIKNCIRLYRYSGSFFNYLFRTLEYSARGKPPVYSLDDPRLNPKKTRIDFLIVKKN